MKIDPFNLKHRAGARPYTYATYNRLQPSISSYENLFTNFNGEKKNTGKSSKLWVSTNERKKRGDGEWEKQE